jgi:hypothetical protein
MTPRLIAGVRRRRCHAVVLALALGGASVVWGREPAADAQVSAYRAAALPDAARVVLVDDLDISPGDLHALLVGDVVGRTIDTLDPHELAAYGATRLTLSKEAFFARYRDVVDFKRHEAVRQIGRFGTPPSLEDVLGLTFEPGTLEDLRACRPGDCKVKLPAATIARLRSDVRWTTPHWRDDCQLLLRQELVRGVHAYATTGEAALPEYADRKTPSRLADQFRAIIEHSSYLERLAPELARYLVEFPHDPLPVTDSFVYWSKEAFGLKPVVSATHVVVYRAAQHPGVMIGASKQLYATHYLEASLGLTIAVDAEPIGGRPSIYLLYVNRSRVDALRGAFGGMRRKIARGKADDGVRETLKGLKTRLEAEERARPAAIAPSRD